MGRTAFTEPHCLYKGDLYLYTFYYEKESGILITLRSSPHQSPQFDFCYNITDQTPDAL